MGVCFLFLVRGSFVHRVFFYTGGSCPGSFLSGGILSAGVFVRLPISAILLTHGDGAVPIVIHCI